MGFTTTPFTYSFHLPREIFKDAPHGSIVPDQRSCGVLEPWSWVAEWLMPWGHNGGISIGPSLSSSCLVACTLVRYMSELVTGGC